MKTITSILVLWFLLVGFAVACNGDDDSDGTPTPPSNGTTETSSVAPSATASLDEVIKASYLEYWEVYADALYNLDSSRLAEVMTGPRLERAVDEVDGLLLQGRAVEIDVVNTPGVVQVDGSRAVLVDAYKNMSRFIDPQTKEPLSSPAEPETIRDTVTMDLVDGIWKVYDSVREAQ